MFLKANAAERLRQLGGTQVDDALLGAEVSSARRNRYQVKDRKKIQSMSFVSERNKREVWSSSSIAAAGQLQLEALALYQLYIVTCVGKHCV